MATSQMQAAVAALNGGVADGNANHKASIVMPRTQLRSSDSTDSGFRLKSPFSNGEVEATGVMAAAGRATAPVARESLINSQTLMDHVEQEVVVTHSDLAEPEAELQPEPAAVEQDEWRQQQQKAARQGEQQKAGAGKVQQQEEGEEEEELVSAEEEEQQPEQQHAAMEEEQQQQQQQPEKHQQEAAVATQQHYVQTEHVQQQQQQQQEEKPAEHAAVKAEAADSAKQQEAEENGNNHQQAPQPRQHPRARWEKMAGKERHSEDGRDTQAPVATRVETTRGRFLVNPLGSSKASLMAMRAAPLNPSAEVVRAGDRVDEVRAAPFKVSELSKRITAAFEPTGSTAGVASKRESRLSTASSTDVSAAISRTTSGCMTQHDLVNTVNAALVLKAGEFRLKPGVDFVPYEELTTLRLEDGLDVTRKEEYLTDEEFEVVFGMDKEDFKALANWKRINAKKAKGLF